MKTGLIRRMDDLGRIVVPKEIRQKLNIHDGDSFSLSVQGSDTICFTKFNILFNENNELVIALFNTLCDIKLRFAIYSREKLILYNVNGNQRMFLDENTPTSWDNICTPERRIGMDWTYHIIPIRVQGENLGYIKAFAMGKADKTAFTIQYILGAVKMVEQYLQKG